MFAAPRVNAHPGPNFWIRIGAFNLAMALVAGVFVGIGLRTLLLAWMDRETGSRRRALRLVNGLLFLALAAYYTYVAWPMIVWDRSARIAFMLTALAPPIVAGIRFAKGGVRKAPKLYARILAGLFGIVLFATAALTLLRAGFITLKGDRVAMLLAVTGETRSLADNSGILEMRFLIPGGEKEVEFHHIILFLPDGTPAADIWVFGNRMAFSGRAVIFSPLLNRLGFPNLYELERITGAGGKGVPRSLNPFVAVLPNVGPLTQRPSWTLLQEAILRAWPRADQNESPWWGVRIIQNQSPDYPLVNADGTPLKKDFLFDITLDGIPTSRYTSPLEKK